MLAESARYTIRYRFDREHHALLVQDATGDAYIVTAAGLACRIARAQRLLTLAPTLTRLGWVPVPEVSPYAMDDLLSLLRPTAA